jgi:uncharacterized protein (UPF0276 family)
MRGRTVVGENASTRAGVGLRLPHLNEVAAVRPRVPWFEIHPENFIANPHAMSLLEQIRADYPISVHTVGVSIGSVGGIDHDHLRRVRELVDRIEPFVVSGHLAWSTHAGIYLNDLLPLPYDEETLALVVRHVDEVQEGLGRPYLVENPSSYVGFRGSTMTEAQFLRELAQHSGCRLLCDVSNIHVSGHNMNFDARAYVDSLPAAAIGQYHLGGFVIEADESGEGDVFVDTHSVGIDADAWDLYAYVVDRIGWRPTLIEWDNDLPDLATLIAQASRADAIAGTPAPAAEARLAGLG